MRGKGRSVAAVSVVLALAVLAGCLAAPKSSSVAPASATDAMAMKPLFTMNATNCEESGFVAAYGGPGHEDTLGKYWKTADIRAEIGNPLHDSTGMPVTGPLSGHWHMGYVCDTVSGAGATQSHFVFGWVAEMIQPPAWDPPGADMEFLISGLALQNGTIADALRATTMADIQHAYDTGVTWYVPKDEPRSAVYTRFTDMEKGLYESYSELSQLRDVGPRTIRLWWQVPADGSMAHMGMDHGMGAMPMDKGPWHPLYWDIHTTGGPQYTTPQMDSGTIVFHNKGSFEHGPVVTQPALTDIYENGALTFTSGHVIDNVTLDALWTH
ncbi:MAG: hypothetical protein ACYDCK_00795 [Thermoplasmatota archaeon]